MTQAHIDALGWIPVAAVFVAQWTGSDRVWVVCNVLFALYHTFLTRLPPLAICAFVLTLISLWRIYRDKHVKKPRKTL